MKFKKLKAENVYSFKKLDFDFKYKGTTLIIGRNEDQNTANGAGKSTLIKALYLGLWGKELNSEPLDLVAHNKGDDGFLIEIEFEDRGHEFKIIRYRDKKDKDPKTGVDFYIDGALFNGEGALDTQKNIERKLKISPKLFLSAVLTRQGEDKHFLTVSDTEKKEIFSELLDLTAYSKAFDFVKDEISELEDKISDTNQKIEHFSERIKERNQEIEAYRKKEENFDLEKKKIIESYEAKKASLEIEILNANSSNSELSTLLDSEKKIQERINKNLKQKDSLGEKLIEEERLSEEYNVASQDLVLIKSKIDRSSEQHQDAERELIKLSSRIENPTILETKIKQLKNSANKAKTILEELKKEHNQIVSSLVEESINVTAEFDSDTDKKIKELQIKKEIISEKLETLKQGLSPLRSKLQELKLKMESLKSHKEEIKKIDKENQELLLISRDLTIKINKISNIESDIKTKQKMILDIDHKIMEERERKNPYKDIMSSIFKKIEDLSSLKEQNKKLEASLEEEMSYLSFWKSAFSPLGIRSFIFDEVIDLLNQKVQENLNDLFDGALSVVFESESKNSKGSMSNKINTKFYLSGKETTFGMLSGGEQRRAIMAVNLALTEIAESYSGTVMNIKFLDEPFDGIDGNGQIQCFKLFNKLSQNKDGFFVISHDQSFQQLCPNAIYITKKDGESKIVQKSEFDPNISSSYLFSHED